MDQSESSRQDWVKKGNTYRLPRLFKRDAGKGLRRWNIAVTANTDGTATIEVQHGCVDGKLSTKLEHIEQGKNLGKKNATNALTQALIEAYATWEVKQRRKGYVLSPDACRDDYRPMLAEKYQDVTIDFWDHAWQQLKYDGFRSRASWDATTKTVTLESRENQPQTTVPHVNAAIAAECSRRGIPSRKFDGELYAHDLTFTQISSAMKRISDPNHEMILRIGFRCYDVIDAETTFERRFVHGMRWLEGGTNPHFQLAPTEPVTNEADLMAFQRQAIADGYEGAMLRNGHGLYEFKRSKNLVKVKTYLDAEFKIIGMSRARDGAAVFKLETDKGYPFEATAHGPQKEKPRYLQNPEKWIGRWLTVKYEGYTTTAKPVPRNPVAVRFRPESEVLAAKNKRKKKGSK